MLSCRGMIESARWRFVSRAPRAGTRGRGRHARRVRHASVPAAAHVEAAGERPLVMRSETPDGCFRPGTSRGDGCPAVGAYRLSEH
jgi:hypothetical protein